MILSRVAKPVTKFSLGCRVFNPKLRAPSHRKIFINHVGWRLYNGLSQPGQFFHFINVQICNRRNLIFPKYFKNLKRNIFLRHNNIWWNQLDFLLEYLKIMVFLVDHTVDIHVLLLLIHISHEPERALQEKDFWVVDLAGHAFVGKVFHENTAVDVLRLLRRFEV